MNIVLKKAILYIGVLCFLVASPGIAFASNFDLVTFSTTPKTPGANTSVLIRMESFAVNLSSAKILWYVNKNLIKESVADTSLKVSTGDFGEETIIDVVIITANGNSYNKQFILAPAEVDVLWEAQTYTPPFYKGKAMPTYKSMVKVTAVPRFKSLSSDPSEYFYTWTYKQTLNIGKALGKNSVIVPMGFAGAPIPVNVEVSLPGTNWKGERYLSIPVFVPKLVMYEQSSLLGISYHHALPKIVETNGTQFTLHVAPYFFSSDDVYAGNIAFKWYADRRVMPSDQAYLNATLEKTGKETDTETKSVTLSIQNPNRILQSASTQVTVSFTPEDNTQ